MNDDLETLARWMTERGYSTGHGDTVDDLLAELDWQIEENLSAWRKLAEKQHENADR